MEDQGPEALTFTERIIRGAIAVTRAAQAHAAKAERREKEELTPESQLVSASTGLLLLPVLLYCDGVIVAVGVVVALAAMGAGVLHFEKTAEDARAGLSRGAIELPLPDARAEPNDEPPR